MLGEKKRVFFNQLVSLVLKPFQIRKKKRKRNQNCVCHHSRCYFFFSSVELLHHVEVCWVFFSWNFFLFSSFFFWNSLTVFSKTTLAPARTKAPGLPKWIVPTGRVLGSGVFFYLSMKDQSVTSSSHPEPCKISHCVLL